jgi:hypothetical protein
MRPLLITSIRAEGYNRDSSRFITSGKAVPAPKAPKPVVDDDPSATIVSVPPARSFAFVDARGAPSDNPFLNPRQAAAGLKGPPWSCASIAVLKLTISGPAGADTADGGFWTSILTPPTTSIDCEPFDEQPCYSYSTAHHAGVFGTAKKVGASSAITDQRPQRRRWIKPLRQ